MKKIGLALSGGGTRAIVFHLGMLKALADAGHWEEITYLSTVSGGSLCIALIMAHNNNIWPTKEKYIDKILPALKIKLTSNWIKDIQLYLFSFGLPFIGVRANFLAFLLSHVWKIKGNMMDLPETPRWAINCTSWETGKNWRFERKRMGDYVTNYVLTPNFPLAKAVAASAAYPWGIGTLKINTSRYVWHKYTDKTTTESVKPLFKYISLWDGGIYDNVGIECFFTPNPNKKHAEWLKNDIDFCIISDASQELTPCKRRYFLCIPIPQWLKSRIAAIATDQIRSVRARWMFNYFNENKNGTYVRMGEDEQCGTDLPKKQYDRIVALKTSLNNFNNDDFNFLFTHAYDLTTCRLKQSL